MCTHMCMRVGVAPPNITNHIYFKHVYTSNLERPKDKRKFFLQCIIGLSAVYICIVNLTYGRKKIESFR